MGEQQDSNPLTSMQQGMIFHSRYVSHSGVYVQQLICDLKEALDISAFKDAWHRVVERHSVFRTSFHWDGMAEPYQRVNPSVRLPWTYEDLCCIPAMQQEICLGEYLQADRRQDFQHTEAPLIRLKLFRFAEAEYKLIWTSHHVLLDGRALILVLRELFHLYEALSKGRDVQLDQPRPFQDYLNWLRMRDVTEKESFWKSNLKGFTAPTRLVFDPAHPVEAIWKKAMERNAFSCRR